MNSGNQEQSRSDNLVSGYFPLLQITDSLIKLLFMGVIFTETYRA